MRCKWVGALLGGLLAASLAPTAVAEEVSISVRSGACEDYRAIALTEAKRAYAVREFPEFAYSVDRTPPEKAIRRDTMKSRRPKDGLCVYDVDVDGGMLKLLLAEYPASLSNLPVAVLIRYVRDGMPVDGGTPDAVKATDIMLEQLDAVEGRPIELVGMGPAFRGLAFFDVSKCALVDGTLNFDDPQCQMILDYDAATERIVDLAREMARDEVSSDQGMGNPQLRPIAACDGLIVVGQVSADLSKEVRNQLDVAIQLKAYRYSDRSVVLSYPDSVSRRVTTAGGARPAAEIEAIDDIIQRATNQLAEKASRSGQSQQCKAS